MSKQQMYQQLLESAIAELVRPSATNDAQVAAFIHEHERLGTLTDLFNEVYKEPVGQFNPANAVDSFCAFRWVAMCNPLRNPVTLQYNEVRTPPMG